MITFSTVAAELEARRADTALISLDAFYGYGVEDATARVGLRPVAVARAGGRLPKGQFYRRPVLAIWRDVLRAKRPIESLLSHIDPDVVVLGNDFGLIEKLVLDLARRQGRASVLVQDGHIFPARGAPQTLRSKGRAAVKRLASGWIGRTPWWYLAASEYGEGRPHLICAAGPSSARLLTERSRHRASIRVTGQPRYDRLIAYRRQVRHSSTGPQVVAFTTPFADAGLDRAAQERQEVLYGALAQNLEAIGGTLTIKPHPRESKDRYRRGAAVVAEPTADPSGLLVHSDVAVLGLSTVIEEACLLGCPVLVPGTTFHGEKFQALLPPKAAFPWFESSDEAMTLIRDVRANPSVLLKRQRSWVQEHVLHDPGRRAAKAVADAILELMPALTRAS